MTTTKPVVHPINDHFKLEGLALGTIVILAGYHLLRAIFTRITPRDLSSRRSAGATLWTKPRPPKSGGPDAG